MINFDEEIQKYHPSLEIDQAEDAIYNTDMTDMVDVLMKMTPDHGTAQKTMMTDAAAMTRKTQRK